MKIPHLGVMIALIGFAACSSDATPEPENNNEEVETPDQKDTSAPELTITDLDSTIEVKTLFQVAVIDDSEVVTKIFIEGEEVFSSSNKQFTYEINPFGIEVGSKTLKIVSEDSNGNTTDEEIILEIKHLLMDFDLGVNEMINVDRAWVFFNDYAGKLITTELLQIGNNKIYTEALIEDDQIYYTLTKFWTYDSDIVHTLSNSTIKLSPGEKRNEFYFVQPNRDQEFELEVTREELVTPWDKFTAWGSNYRQISFHSTSAPSYAERYSLEYAFPETIYVRTAMANDGDTFDGKKENYLYHKINPEPQDSKITIFEKDFVSMDDFTVQDIPPHDISNFTFSRFGYENEDDMDNDIYHLIYTVNESFDFILSGYLDLPILDGLTSYKNTARFEKDGRRVYAQQFGNSIDLTIPSWEVNDFGSSDGNYFIEVDNEEVDYYLLSLSKTSSTSNPRKNFNWVYRTFGNAPEDRAAPMLSLPEAITTSLGDQFYTADALNINYVTAVDFVALNSFSEATDYQALRKIALKVNEQDYKSVRFTDVNPSTGKSHKMPELHPSADETRF